MSDEAEFKPCPFCGAGETYVDEGTKVWLGTRYGEPVCYVLNHFCEVNESNFRQTINFKSKTYQEVIDLWNRRI